MSKIKDYLENNGLEKKYDKLSTEIVDRLMITFISDTHGELIPLDELPAADVIVHAGDAGLMGTKGEMLRFLEWFGSLPYKEKVFIPGNHDVYFEGILDDKDAQKELEQYGVHILTEGELVIDGIKFYGCSWQPVFFNWAFNKREKDLVHHWNKIPLDVDVLITHSPAFGTLDKNLANISCGSASLVDAMKKLKSLKLHLFGHIHEDYGERLKDGFYSVNGARVSNSSRGPNPPWLLSVSKSSAKVHFE